MTRPASAGVVVTLSDLTAMHRFASNQFEDAQLAHKAHWSRICSTLRIGMDEIARRVAREEQSAQAVEGPVPPSYVKDGKLHFGEQAPKGSEVPSGEHAWDFSGSVMSFRCGWCGEEWTGQRKKDAPRTGCKGQPKGSEGRDQIGDDGAVAQDSRHTQTDAEASAGQSSPAGKVAGSSPAAPSSLSAIAALDRAMGALGSERNRWHIPVRVASAIDDATRAYDAWREAANGS